MSPSIIYIMGVSGSGKTTIGKSLSTRTGLPFFDGDDFHPERNIEKMRSGVPLTDEDRKDFLIAINRHAKEQMNKSGAIIACSALKEKYRKVLADGMRIPVYWVFLEGDYDLILQRLRSRTGHFMPQTLLASQFDTLEVPMDCIRVDIAEKPEAIVESIFRRIGK